MAKPRTWPIPRQEKAILRLVPLVIAVLMIPIEVGKQSAIAIPCMARNMINSMPVFGNPQASMKRPSIKVPVRLTMRLPMTSAIEPARRRHEPLVSLILI